MTRNSFDLKLQLLHQDLLNMSEIVERQIENSIESLKKQSIELALQVIDGDDLIDRYEKMCIRDRSRKVWIFVLFLLRRNIDIIILS